MWITGKKEKVTTTPGRVSVNNAHPFSQLPFGFHISSLLREFMVYAGTLDCYSKSREVLSRFISVEVSDVWVWAKGWRCKTAIVRRRRALPTLSISDKLYAEADGSMIFSREEGWREAKVGRLFHPPVDGCLHPDGKPGFIKESQGLATLEKSKTFCGTLDQRGL